MSKTECQRVQNCDNHTQKMQLRFPQPWRSLLLAQNRQPLPQREILGGQGGAVSDGVSNHHNNSLLNAHFTGLVSH